MKKIIALLVVVTLGIAIGALWTREPQNSSSPMLSEPSTRESVVSERERPRLTLPPNALAALRPTVDPVIEPERHKVQADLWRSLQSFAKQAALSDAQWGQFERDLSDVYETEATATTSAMRVRDYDGLLELNQSLEDEFLARCAVHMTDRQMRILRVHFPGGLITRVRWAHYKPSAEI